MIRYAGAAVIGIIGLCLGCIAAERLRRRVTLLREFILVLEQMAREIDQRRTALPELMETLGRDRLRLHSFFEPLKKTLKAADFTDFAQRWQQALEPLELTNEDKLLLREVGRCLGRYDAATQVQILLSTKSALEQQLKDAQELHKQNARLYRILGVIGGLLVIILAW